MTTSLPAPVGIMPPDAHMAISRRFLQQAREELAKSERLQASDKIWGAASHAIAAVGKERGWLTDDYFPKQNIAAHLSEEFNNPALLDRYTIFQAHHVNFYQNDRDEGEIRRAIDHAEAFVDAIQRIRESEPQPFTVTEDYQIHRIRVISGRAVEKNVTYHDGFVNANRLRRYRQHWAQQSDDDAANGPASSTPAPGNGHPPDGANNSG